MKERGCQAEVHDPKCPCLRCKKPARACETCRNLTVDHFTPKCIAKHILGWSDRQTNSRDNTQYLSTPCHQLKDRYTGEIYNQAMAQKKGKKIRFGEYVEYQKKRGET